MSPKSELTSRFRKIEMSNFDVEKMVLLNFCFKESSKWACVKENANEMISVYDYKSVVVKVLLGAWKIKLF